MKGIELANYIVSKQIEEGKPTNTLSLQKVMYYVNAKYMHERNEAIPFIKDGFEKWKFGPVNVETYNEYSFFGALPITSLPFTQVIYWDKDNFSQELDELGLTQSQLDTWVDRFIVFDRFDLVEATHRQRVWLDYEALINSGRRDLAYSTEEIFEELMSDPDEFFRI